MYKPMIKDITNLNRSHFRHDYLSLVVATGGQFWAEMYVPLEEIPDGVYAGLWNYLNPHLA